VFRNYLFIVINKLVISNNTKGNIMNALRFFLAALILCPILSFGQNKNYLPRKELQSSAEQIPHLERQGTATQLVVKGEPFLLISGEVHNSTTGGFAYMRPVWKRLEQRHLNSVIAPVSWELLEPEEGKFDFSQVDSVIAGVRKAHLKLVLIWFASWKNGGSTYIPSWVKENFKKYPRAKDETGKPLEILSTFGEASVQADAKAFAVLMHHIREIDRVQQTVVMIQVENEVGVLDNMGKTPGTARRDFSKAANTAFNGPVPHKLMDYLVIHKDSLNPELYKVWSEHGFKTSGTWEEVFGKGEYTPDKNDYWHSFPYYTEELFMAWHYAKYIEEVAAAGKKEYPIPMYMNTWLRFASCYVPGKFPSGGPLPEVLDVWRAGAPSIDIFSPDAGVWGKSGVFEWVCKQYIRNGNPLFIPETSKGKIGAARVFDVFGEYNAGCFSPFGIDDPVDPKKDVLAESYNVVEKMEPIILINQGKGTMRGILVDSASPVQKFEMGDYWIEAQLRDQQKLDIGGGLIIQTGKESFIVAGRGISVSFAPKDSTRYIGVNVFDEGTFKNGKWVTERRLNGDEGPWSSGSRVVMSLSDNEECIRKISFYEYK
jgi:beta-galactosidase GanA